MEVPSVPNYVSKRKIVLSSRKMVEKSDQEPKSKKSKWGNFANSQKIPQASVISTDSLKLDSNEEQCQKKEMIDIQQKEVDLSELKDTQGSSDEQESPLEENSMKDTGNKKKSIFIPVDNDDRSKSKNELMEIDKEISAKRESSIQDEEHNSTSPMRKTHSVICSNDDEENEKHASIGNEVHKENLNSGKVHKKSDDKLKISCHDIKNDKTETLHDKCDDSYVFQIKKKSKVTSSLTTNEDKTNNEAYGIKTKNENSEMNLESSSGFELNSNKNSKNKKRANLQYKKDYCKNEHELAVESSQKTPNEDQPDRIAKLTEKHKSRCSEKSSVRRSSQRSDIMLPPSASIESNKVESTEPMEIPSVPTYVSKRKIVLTSRKIVEKTEDLKSKKSKWGNFSNSQKSHQIISISTDSLKNWFPDLKLLRNPEPNEMVCEDLPPTVKEDNTPDTFPSKMDEGAEPPMIEGDSGIISNILFIQNLVRPFTLLQLKELLQETGHITDFWIDKIKSKCCVTYETEDEAIRTRNALNGKRWPSSNPKILSVEFSTEDELNFHKNGGDLPKPVPSIPPSEPVERSHHRSKEEERRRPIREWDKDKVIQESPVRELKNPEKTKTSDKRDKKEGKRRSAEDTPAKLLDDLFQKTKSSPCIYWLPLTEQQVLEREETRRQRRQERERRNQALEETEEKNKRPQPSRRTRDAENRRSSTRSRSPVSRRR